MVTILVVLVALNLIVNGYIALRLFPIQRRQPEPELVAEPPPPQTAKERTLNRSHIGTGPFSPTIGFRR